MTIEWKKLRHQHGPATKVPTLVKALTASKGRSLEEQSEHREEAYEKLMESLVERGQWYSASLPTAELLVEALVDDRPGLHRVLELLYDILGAHHLHWLSHPLRISRKLESSETAIRALVLPTVPRLLELLAHPQPEVRSAAALLLGCLVEEAEATGPALHARLALETQPEVLATTTFALAVLAARSPSTPLPEAPSSLLEHPSAEVRELYELGRLQRGLAEVEDIGPILWDFALRQDPCFYGAWGTDAVLVAISMSLGSEVSESVVRILIDELLALDAHDGRDISGPVHVIHTLSGFSKRWPDNRSVALPEELSALQREVAERLSRCRIRGPFGHGLPAWTRFFRRWLELVPPTPLEERMEVILDGRSKQLPRWWVLRRLKDLGIDEREIKAFVLGLTPAQQLRFIADCESEGYDLFRVLVPGCERTRLADLLTAIGDDTAWVSSFVEDYLGEPWTPTPVGPIMTSQPNIQFCLLTLLARAKVALEARHVVLLSPYDIQDMPLRGLLTELPYDFREEGMYRNLFTGPRPAGVTLIDALDLFASQRVITRLLELEAASDGIVAMSVEERERFRQKIQELSDEHDEVRNWVQDWHAQHVGS